VSASPAYARSVALSRRVGDEVLLARPEGSGVDRLSIPASALWLLLERPRTRADLIRLLGADFEMGAEEMAGHIDRLIRELESSGWIARAKADD
jgi:coenzyme PQQ synthesis protein D (PqqD)